MEQDDDTRKRPWTFDAQGSTPELRAVRALEYIAMYLDKIEGHMDRIADAAEGRDSKDEAWARDKALRQMLRP